jgi:hypothetical protein
MGVVVANEGDSKKTKQNGWGQKVLLFLRRLAFRDLSLALSLALPMIHALSPISSACGNECKSPIATYVGFLLTRSPATL